MTASGGATRRSGPWRRSPAAVSLWAAAVWLAVVPRSSLASTKPSTLRDHPVQGAAAALLDGDSWTASSASAGLSIQARVPGDIITDLQNAGRVGDPLYELNFLAGNTEPLWGNQHSWTYATNFTLPAGGAAAAAASSMYLLVFDGVKMGARVSVNGVEVGTVTNQFKRYIFPLDASVLRLKPPGASQTLEVAFDGSLSVHGRFMACTGGWDWAPLTPTNINDTEWGVASTYTRGIWKSVQVVAVPAGTPAITHVTPLTRFEGAYPVEPLVDGKHGGFTVNTTVHLWSPPGGAIGTLAVSGEWGASASTQQLTLPAGDSAVSVQLRAAAQDVALWWPNGVGRDQRPLYNVTTTWTSASAVGSNLGAPGSATEQSSTHDTTAQSIVSATRRIGFRVPALVTVNDTNATYVANNTHTDGSGTHGMFFRVNGAAMYARGGNLVPMDELEGRLDAGAYAQLVAGAADAGMNAIRVWGGGIYPPDAFYDACDERGIILYHDMQFAGRGHDPSMAYPLSAASRATVEGELRHQVRRLSHHPAVVLYDGANEVIVNRTGPTTVYSAVVMTTVAEEDSSRIVWPASPAAGWLTGVNQLYGTPNGAPLVALVGHMPHIWSAGNERHGQYTAGVGDGFPTVCSDPWSQAPTFGPNMPIGYLDSTRATGVHVPSLFVSEFGATAMSSFESMSPTLAPVHWGLHGGAPADNCTDGMVRNCTGGNVMAQRNWACDNVIWSFFGDALLNATGEAAFKAQLYLCQVGQALVMKQNIEGRRAANELGALTWQLNEVWPTGGWGSLEYGSIGFTKGQVRGGRWKPLHYWFKASLFAQVMATCGHLGRTQQVACFVANDHASAPFSGVVTLSMIDLAGDGAEVEWARETVSMEPGPRALHYFTPPNDTLPNTTTTVVVSRVADASGALVSEHMVQLTAPMNLALPPTRLSVSVTNTPNPDGSIDVNVTSDRVAVFVTLTTLAQGRFSDNCFLLPATTRTVQFIPFAVDGAPGVSDRVVTGDDYVRDLKSSIRVEDLSMYLAPTFE